MDILFHLLSREGRSRLSNARQGSVLAGRYRLERRIQTDPDGALWRAQDSTLDRLVNVRVLRPGHPFAADVADAARRAALVDDPRLVRVLDVGSDGTTSFVVSEHIDGETLAAMTERGPLPGPLIRRVIGEVAQGLAGAAGRGLHHLRLTPRSVLITPSGSIKLIGTATEAAAAGLESDHADTANRVDAVGLIALLYSGLTGRWPLGDAGYPPAPHGDDASPVPPADLARDVPADLDTLCAVTLGPHNDGPRSPAEVARQLAPWPNAEQARALTAAPPLPPIKDLRPATLANQPKPMVKPSPSSLFAPITPVSPDSIRTARRAAAARALAKPVPHEPAGQLADGTQAGSGSTSDAAPDVATADPQVTAGPATSTSSAAAAGARKPPGARANEKRAGGATSRSSEQTALLTPNDALPQLTGSPHTESPHTESPHTESPRTARRAAIRNHPDSGELLLPWSGTWTPASANPDNVDLTGPFPIIIPSEPPPPRQSRLVLAGVGVAVVIGLVLAVFSLRDFGRSGDQTSAVTPLTSTSTPSSAAQPQSEQPSATTDPPTTSAPAVTAAAPQIAAIRAIDPEGDNEENGSDAPKAVDEVASTQWTSDTYKTSRFGGLKKGLGLAIRLQKPAVVHQVEVDIKGSGGTVQLRGGPTYQMGQSTLLGSSDVTSSTVTLTSDSTQTYQYIIVWITKLPFTDNGYRAEISEVRVT